MGKQTFSVQCRDQEGELYSVKVPADTEEEARSLAARQGNVVEGSGQKWRGQLGPKAKYQPGESLETAASILGIVGLLIFPCAVVSLVLGACAKERSDGKRGGFAMTLGGVGVVVSILVMAFAAFAFRAESARQQQADLLRIMR